MLCEHAPATLEAKDDEVSGVWEGGESLTAVRVRQGGSTPLHLASDYGHVPVARLLVERAPQLLEMRDEVRGLSLSPSLPLSLSLPVN